MTTAPTIDIRSEAVTWLEDELQAMNDNGAHWVRSRYGNLLEDGSLAMCIKGASNFTLIQRLGGFKDDLLASIKEKWGWTLDDQELHIVDILGETSMLRNVVAEKNSNWIEVQDAVEIALNIAIGQLTGENTITREFEIAESNITSFNDHGTDWKDVVKVHEMAIDIVKVESTPLTWEEYGKRLSNA